MRIIGYARSAGSARESPFYRYSSSASGPKRAKGFERYIEDGLERYNEHDLVVHTQAVMYYRGEKCIPDFVVQSRGRSACVVVDAKHYNGNPIPKREVDKLRRDMEAAEANGYGVCLRGFLFVNDSAIISESLRQYARERNIGIVFEGPAQGRRFLLNRKIYNTFYGA